MGINTQTYVFGLNDLGLTPRFRIDVESFEKTNLNASLYISTDLPSTLQKDERGEYTLTMDHLVFMCNAHQVFYDDSEKIFEYWYDKHTQVIVIHVSTTIQTNLFIDVIAKECFIKAEGPLCIDGQFTIESRLSVSALSLCVFDSIQCKGHVVLEAMQSVYLSSKLDAKYAQVSAAYLLQAADICLEGQYDISVQVFQQLADYKTQMNALRLLAEQCEIAGEFNVDHSCFIASNKLIIGGKNDTHTHIQFNGEHHVHAIEGLMQGNSIISIHDVPGISKTFTSKCIFDKQLYLDTDVSFSLKNSLMDVHELNNKGEIYLDACEVIANSIKQNGFFEAQHSDIWVSEQFSHHSNEQSLISNSEISIPVLTVNLGSLVLNDTKLIGTRVSVRSGLLHIENKSEVDLQSLFSIDKTAKFEMTNSQLTTINNITVYGSITLQQSVIDSKAMHLDSNQIKINQCKFTIDERVRLNGLVTIVKSTLKSSKIKLTGVLSLDELLLDAKQLGCVSQKATITKSIVCADIIVIEGSDLKYDSIFTESRLVAKTFSIKNQLVINKGLLIGIDDKEMCHDIQGMLTLENSRFITDSQLHHLKGSHLHLCELSSIRMPQIHSEGTIAASASDIYCDEYIQDEASVKLTASKIKVGNTLRAKSTTIDLNHNSALLTSTAIVLKKTHLRLTGQSILLASQQVRTHAHSSIHSDNATLISFRFISLGRVELSESLLSVDELLIYEQFNAQDQSFISVNQRVSLAKTGILQLDSSQTKATDMDSFGQLNLNESGMHVENKLSLWSDSKSEMQGTSFISAADAVVRGVFVTKKTIDDERKLPFSNQSKPQIQIQNKMHVSPCGQFIGDEDLLLNVNRMDLLGKFDLNANLCMKGRLFTNYGSVKTHSTYLGFDDAVVNHGVFSSKSLTFHTNFFNILGQVYAKQSLACSGFMSLNVGIIAANNYTNDSFISLNGGLILPNLTADPKYIFSMGNLLSVAKTVAFMTMPGYSSTIQLLGMIPGLMSTAGTVYNLSNKLDFTTLKKMRRHEYMPILCQIKNVVLFGQGLFNTSSSFGKEIKIWDASFSKLTHKPGEWFEDAWSSLKKTDWEKMGLRTAGAFAGSYNDNSVLHANVGGNFVANTSKTSILHMNAGMEQSAFSHNINTSHMYNKGTSTGTEANFSATYIYNDGTLKGTRQYTLRAQRVENDKNGMLQGREANVKIKQLHQAGHMDIEKGHLKIDEFLDEVDAETKITDALLRGKTFDQSGKTNFKNVLIEESEHFITNAGSEEVNNNVAIKTKDYEHHGVMNYKNSMSITADKGIFAAGSVVHGQKTDEDTLFVPKQSSENEKTKDEEVPTEDATEKKEDKPKEPEKEFKPQHVLLINIDHQTLSGELSGGDYTQIKGKNEDIVKEDGTTEKALCNDLIIDETANIDLKYGSIAAEKASFSSKKVALDSFGIHIKDGSFNHNSAVTLKNSSYTGDILNEDGTLILEHSQLKIDTINLTKNAHETLLDSAIIATEMNDKSQMSYQGQAAIIADKYNHNGHVSKIPQPNDSKDKNLFYVKAKSAVLNGSTDLDNGFYDIEHLSDGTQFAAGTGKYTLYMASDSMTFKTDDSFRLYDSIQRNCDVSVQAADIYYGGNYNQQHDLTFVSTAGDVTLTNAIQARNLFVKSAKNIYTNNSIYTQSNLCFEADGGYYNYGGTLNGDNVAIKAAEIKNYTRGASAVANGTVLPMGNAGIINARNKLFLEATKGNIENHGGVLRAGNYAQLLAKGDVLNLCNIKTSKGRYDTIKTFDGGLIAGGNGTDTDGIGLYIKAEGRVISDASDFVSNGSNYIEGIKGVQFTARSHTAITKNKTTSTWYGKKKTVVETSTTVKGCNIQSANGRNIIQSGEGSVTSVASRFISPGGTDIYAKGDVKLYSLKTQDRYIEVKSSFWGLTKHEIDSIHQSATPTLFVDNGATRITSAEGNVDARGAYFIGAGDLSIKAKKQILFGVDILNHETTEKSNAFHFSATGMGAWEAYKNGGNVWDVVTAEDATLAKINSLCHSNNNAELLANASNLGIDLCNTSNNVMRGIGQGNITEELLARYGLGGASGFAPSLTLSMTQSKTKTTYQTQSQGGVDRGGNVKFEAGEGVVLENGVKVHAGGNLEIDAPILVARAAALNTTVKETTVTESIGIAPFAAQMQSAGASYSQTQTRSTTYQNAELSANGNMYLHNKDKAMDSIELDGANIRAKTLDMNTNKLIIKDKQNTSETTTKSYSVNSSGQFSIYEGKGHEKVTDQNSGIYVADGINTDGHKVHVGETYMEGGKITTDGVNHFETDKLESHALEDEKQYTGIGISGNINDFNRWKDQKPENMAGEQTFATANITYDKVDYKATQSSVIYGAQGTVINVKEFVGDEVCTSNADGKAIQKDVSMHLQLDVPITNAQYLEAAHENIKAGKEKLADIFGLNPHEKEPVDFRRPEPLKPEEDELEEKDDEAPTKPEDDLADTFNEQDMLNDVMKNLQFDSPEAEQAFQATLKTADDEIKQNGKISSKTANTLKEQLTAALMLTLKTGSEYKWGKLIDKLDLTNPNYYMKTKGGLISFFYNVLLSSLDDEVKRGDEIKHAVIKTSVELAFDAIFELAMKKVSQEALGPIGAASFIFGLLNCFYDQKRIDAQNATGLAYLNEAQEQARQGHPLDAWALRQAAADHMGTAARAQAGNNFANFLKPIVTKIEKQWDERKKNKSNVSMQGMFKQTLNRAEDTFDANNYEAITHTG